MILILQIIVYIIIGLIIYIIAPGKIKTVRELENEYNMDQLSAESSLFYVITFLWPILILMVVFSLISRTMIKCFGRKKE